MPSYSRVWQHVNRNENDTRCTLFQRRDVVNLCSEFEQLSWSATRCNKMRDPRRLCTMSNKFGTCSAKSRYMSQEEMFLSRRFYWHKRSAISVHLEKRTFHIMEIGTAQRKGWHGNGMIRKLGMHGENASLNSIRQLINS